MLSLNKILILFLITLCFCSISAAEDLNDLFRQPDFASICLSPDGSKIAYFSNNWSENLSIIIQDVITDVKTKLSLPQKDPNQKYWSNLDWESNTKLVFAVGTYKNGPGPVYSINSDGSDLKEIFKSTNSYTEVILPYIWNNLPFDSSHVLVKVLESRIYEKGNFTRTGYNYFYTTKDYYFIWNFYSVNVFTGEKELVYGDKEMFNSVGFDMLGHARFAVKESDGEQTYLLNDNNNWKPLNIRLDDSTNFPMIMSAAELSGHHCFLLGAGFDNNIFYYASNLSSDRMNIYEYNIENNKSYMIAEAAEYDLADPLSEVGDSKLLFSNKSKKLVGFNFIAEKEETIWLDEKFSQIQVSLNEKLTGRVNKIIDWDNNEENFLIFSFSSTDAGEYYLFDLKEKNLILIGYNNYALKDVPLNKTYPIDFKSRDGSTIHGYLTLPADISKRPFPLIVNAHGGPWARDYYTFNPSAQFFTKNGYAYLQVNFRGSTGMGYNHFVEAKRNSGLIALLDIADGVNALIVNSIVDSKRVAIMGTSYGGYASLMSLVKHDTLYSCGIDIAGPTDLTSQINSYLPEFGRSLSYEFWENMMGEKEKLGLISPINYCSRINKPVLVIHGENDKIVSVEQSRRFVSEMEDLNKNIKYMELENEGHGGWSVSNSIKIHTEILNFLESNQN